MSDSKQIHIIGGGLAGSEAAHALLQAGYKVRLYEMRPKVLTPAHKTGNLAELVCSNSLKSIDEFSAPGILKNEMASLGSLIVEAGYAARVPAGQALAVDREVFSKFITDRLMSHTRFELVSGEVQDIPDAETLKANGGIWLIATGPLTSKSLAENLRQQCGNSDDLYFYDAIAPTLDFDSINMDVCFRASRYDKGDADYINIPMDKNTYDMFIDEVAAAEKAPLHDFEKAQYFESCLPIEVMIERGRDTLRFGPMKPVGLTDPKTGRYPYAAIQLRQENQHGTLYSMVGFQTKMKWPEQKRVFSKIPGLEDAVFVRYGSIHRNTYVHGPKVLNPDLSLKNNPGVFLAGQITGVEGYTESSAMGLIAAQAIKARLEGRSFVPPPVTTILGALLDYVTGGPLKNYQPMNTNFGLLPRPAPGLKSNGKPKKLDKATKKQLQSEAARQSWQDWIQTHFD